MADSVVDHHVAIRALSADQVADVIERAISYDADPFSEHRHDSEAFTVGLEWIERTSLSMPSLPQMLDRMSRYSASAPWGAMCVFERWPSEFLSAPDGIGVLLGKCFGRVRLWSDFWNALDRIVCVIGREDRATLPPASPDLWDMFASIAACERHIESGTLLYPTLTTGVFTVYHMARACGLLQAVGPDEDDLLPEDHRGELRLYAPAHMWARCCRVRPLRATRVTGPLPLPAPSGSIRACSERMLAALDAAGLVKDDA